MVGFFGAGLIANYHAWSLQHGGAYARPAVVFDPVQDRAQAFAERFGARVADSETDVFDRSQAIYVCTWTSEHQRLVAAACARRLPIFCEKPLATDVAGAEAMSAEVARAGVVNQVGLVLRSSPGFALLRQLIADPAAGRVLSVTFRDDQQIPLGGFYGSDWRGDRAKAGSGTLLEHSIHDLDILEWLCGPIERLGAQSANFHGLEGIEDTVAVSFSFENGGTGVLTSVWHDVRGRISSRRLEVFCERARLWAEGNLAETVGWELQAGHAEERAGNGVVSELQTRGWAIPGNADVAFVEAAALGGRASPDFADALRAHCLADAVYRSAETGGLPVVTGTPYSPAQPTPAPAERSQAAGLPGPPPTPT
jgi:myo-inositol 2-dehydrogenase/D-chiro-inositol 1-dehydrogenase